MNPDRPYDQLADSVDSPMYVVTVAGAGEQAGCLVGFSVQCSIDPLRHLVCLSKANRTYELACAASTLVVHALHPGDEPIASLFGEHTDRDVDKFARCAWQEGPDATPVLDGLDWFAGRIVDRLDLGDHEGFLLDVDSEGTAVRCDEPRLGFQAVHDFDAGNPAEVDD